jgi:NAD+ kinase
MVFNRSLVLHPDEAVRLEVLPDHSVIESVDGRAARELPPGAVVEVRRGRHDALLVRIERSDFYGLVRSKFRLADPPRPTPVQPRLIGAPPWGPPDPSWRDPVDGARLRLGQAG